jgi:hypothetical protein
MDKDIRYSAADTIELKVPLLIGLNIGNNKISKRCSEKAA